MATQLDSFLKQTTKIKQYNGSELGKRLYGGMAALSHQTSFYNLEMIVALLHAALLADSGIPVDVSKVSYTVPSSQTLKELLCDCVTYALYQVASEVKSVGARVFFMADKGAKKGRHTHFVKIISWFSDPGQCINILIWTLIIATVRSTTVPGQSTMSWRSCLGTTMQATYFMDRPRKVVVEVLVFLFIGSLQISR